MHATCNVFLVGMFHFCIAYFSPISKVKGEGSVGGVEGEGEKSL